MTLAVIAKRSQPWRWLLLCCWLPALAGLAAVPDFATVKAGFRSSYAQLLDRHGEPLHARRVDMQHHRLSWVSLDDVSPALVDALVFAEDRDFYLHHGVDWRATLYAGLKFLGGDKSRGASTISMQVAALVQPELGWRPGGRSLRQKWRQLQAARELEAHWSKAEILETYVNLLSYRGDLQGIAAASQALYGKAPIALTRAESLLLAALLPSPAAPAARIAQRACALIAAGFTEVECQTARDLALQILDRRRLPLPDNPALDAVSARLLSSAGEQRRSSLDAGIQRQAEDSLRTQLRELRSRNVDAGAVLVLDNASGEVLAYVGNAGLVESARFVDAVQAYRQAGSTLKPLLYQRALEQRYLTAASVLEDSPLSLSTPNGLYTPQNYDKDFKGPVSVRTALAGSLNVPAVRTLALVGVEDFWQRLRELGFSSLIESPEFYGYALALGSADVNLWMLANAYRALASGGQYSEPTFDLAAPHAPRRVMDAAASYVVADILSDRQARAITFGWDSPLATPFWTAVKTGTSKDMRDNWCIGFSQRYTVAVWVGNMNGAPMRDVSGVTGAAPVWSRLMTSLEGGRVRLGEFGPAAPDGLVRQTVHFQRLNEPARAEWFLVGTEMSLVDYQPASSIRILSPANETLIALDPDIPAAQQRLRFQAETGGQALSWWLNEQKLGPAQPVDWAPRPGQYRLSLRDDHGRDRDVVVFSVRGRITP